MSNSIDELIYKKYDPIIGVEIHIELNTKTKMFCACKNSFELKPNKNVCPVCLGFPGSLPTINKKAIEFAIKLGLSLNCKIEKNSFMSRKNYYYPDLSKNYQISQSTKPIVYDGFIKVPYSNNKLYKVDIERAHMEEDAAKNTHIGGSEGRLKGANNILINYNRGGVPLIEIVTKPMTNLNKNASIITKNYVETIRDLAIGLNISDAKMQEGSLRADINISLRKKTNNFIDQKKIPFGIRTEIKNVNSFKTIEKAIDYEIKRQAEILDKKNKIIQETRHFQNEKTISGREKSDSDDYRYFPEPDLVFYSPSEILIKKLNTNDNKNITIKEKIKLQKKWGFSDLEMKNIIKNNIFNLIKKTIENNISPLISKKWWNFIYENSGVDIVSIENIIEIEKLINNNKINNKIAKKILFYLIKGENNITDIINKYNLFIVEENKEFKNLVISILKEDDDILNKLKNNNMKVIGVIIGKVMKKTNNKADVTTIKNIVLENINNL